MQAKIQKIFMLSLLIGQMLLPSCSAGAKSQKEGPGTLHKETPQIKVKASLSQTKILQGSDGMVYLQVDIQAPDKIENKSYSERKPTDLVVVLDRSGSMSAAKKMEYVHQALQTLIRQLSPQDRFALVSFDDQAEINFYLNHVSPQEKAFLQQKVLSIQPRGNTNISSGLQSAIQMLRENKNPYRSERIILISDGLANRGITDPMALSNMVTNSTQEGTWNKNPMLFSLSTIGVGLEFNEFLLSNLADRGQGNYHYLQNPGGMFNILSQEFRGASEIYASNLELNLDLAPDIILTDASGYPIQRQGNHYIIRPGHLAFHQSKTLYFSLALPSSYVYPSRPLGNMDLSFFVQEKFYQVAVMNADLHVACIPITRKYEIGDSINKKVHEQVWTKNNYGKALKESADRMAKGDESGAYQVMQSYRSKVSEANSAAPSPALEKQVGTADKAKTEMEKAFNSPQREEDLKSVGKGFHYEGIQQQR